MTAGPTRILTLLRRGRTVAWVCDATTWPRRQVVAAAAAAGMAWDPKTDRCVAPDDETAYPATGHRRPTQVTVIDHGLGRLERITAQAEGSTRHRIRIKAAQVRTMIDQLDKALQREREREASLAELAALRAELAQAETALRAAEPEQPARTRGYNAAEVRAWAKANGIDCPARGSILPAGVLAEYRKYHPDR